MTSDNLKSLLAAGFVMFLMLVVFGGRITRPSFYGISSNYRVSYCHNADRIPILGDIPCFAFNLLVSLLIIGILLAAVVLIRLLIRTIRD